MLSGASAPARFRPGGAPTHGRKVDVPKQKITSAK